MSSLVLAPVDAARVFPVWRRSWKRRPVIPTVLGHDAMPRAVSRFGTGGRSHRERRDAAARAQPTCASESKASLVGPKKSSPSASPKSAPVPAAEGEEPAVRALNLTVDSDLLREFHSESLELLQFIEQGVLVLEANPTDSETINSIFRAFHTFKGGAGLLGLGALRDLAHDLESLLKPFAVPT